MPRFPRFPEHPPRKEAAWLPSAKWQKRGKPVGPWKSAKLSCGKTAKTCYFRSPCESKGHVHLLEGWKQAYEKEEGWIDPGMRTPTMNAMSKHYIDRLENSALKLRNLDGDRGQPKQNRPIFAKSPHLNLRFCGGIASCLCHEHYKITIQVYDSHIGPQWKQQITRDACRRRGQLSGPECNALQSFPPVRLSKDGIVHCECFMCR